MYPDIVLICLVRWTTVIKDIMFTSKSRDFTFPETLNSSFKEFGVIFTVSFSLSY